MTTQISHDIKRFNHLISEIDATYHEMALKLGLSDSAMRILYTLCENENGHSCLLKDICYLTGLSKQTVHSALSKLEKDGILCLEMAEGRKKRVVLTKAGIQTAERTVLKIIETENRIFARWPKEDVEMYLGFARRYLEDLRKETYTGNLQSI